MFIFIRFVLFYTFRTCGYLFYFTNKKFWQREIEICENILGSVFNKF